MTKGCLYLFFFHFITVAQQSYLGSKTCSFLGLCGTKTTGCSNRDVLIHNKEYKRTLCISLISEKRVVFKVACKEKQVESKQYYKNVCLLCLITVYCYHCRLVLFCYFIPYFLLGTIKCKVVVFQTTGLHCFDVYESKYNVLVCHYNFNLCLDTLTSSVQIAAKMWITALNRSDIIFSALWKNSKMWCVTFRQCLPEKCLGCFIMPYEQQVSGWVCTLFFSQLHDNEKRQIPSSKRGQVHITEAYITALISM